MSPICRRLGRRGMILAGLGVIWVCTGLTTLTAPPSDTYPLLSGWEGLRAAGWITTGTIAIICAPLRQGDDATGWVALWVMAAYRSVAYGHGLLLWVLDHDTGTARGGFGLLSWAVALLILVVGSGWEEPRHPRDPEEVDAE